MPVVDVDTDELRELVGRDVSDDQLKEDLFALGLEFEGETDDGELQFEFAPDRLDRLSVEGVARSLRYQYGDARGVAVPNTNDPDWVIEVAETVPDERPYVTGAVVRGLELDEAALESLIQLQEKLHATMGRDRAKGAIGVHDLTMLRGEQLSGGGGLAEVTSGDADPTGDDPVEYTPAGEQQIDEEGTVRHGTKSITYRGIAPDGDRFVPLDHESMERIGDGGATPAEVVADHPTGDTYGGIVAEYERYPAIYDEQGLFSFPPVINGQRTEVSTDSRDLLIELTGTEQWTIDRMCTIICYALAARGGRIEEVRVEYADGAQAPDEGRELLRPDLTPDEKSVSHARIERTLGIELEPDTVVDLFERSGMDAVYSLGEETVYDVEIPPYRVDVLHPADLVDDVGRAYGFNTLETAYPDIGTVGGRRESSRLEDAVRTSLVGLGFQDTLNFNMTAPAANYHRMRLDRPAPDAGADDRVVPSDGPLGARPAVEITSPYSEEYTQLRTWALPSLVQVLANNTHRSYPQDLAEIGFVAHRDDREPTNVAETRHVAGVLARTDAGYEDAKARLQAVCADFGREVATPPTDHPSFLDGRVAAVEIDGERVGVIGELHPEVLVAHDLEVPVAGFEFALDALDS
ncbi:MAG: phenylalanine--tRNA ligase subunit beta [Halobaculum sp.]